MSKKRDFWEPPPAPRWCPKMKVEKKVILSLKLFKMFLAYNIIVGHSFDIKIDAPRVWSMSGHYTSSTTGRLFKKCQKISQKIAKNCSWGILLEEKCCSMRVQHQKFLSEINFMCMNFIRLRELPAGSLPGRDNTLLRWSMGFAVRAKKNFHVFLVKKRSFWGKLNRENRCFLSNKKKKTFGEN